MRLLTIVRHAKASSQAPAQRDFDRALAAIGQTQIARIAPILSQIEPPPDRIVASPAKRAAQTAEELMDAIQFNRAISFEEHIYEASAGRLMAVLKDQPASVNHVLLIGHNPGMEKLTASLCSGGGGHVNLRIPPAGAAHMELGIAQWSQVRSGCGLLHFLIAPHHLTKPAT